MKLSELLSKLRRRSPERSSDRVDKAFTAFIYGRLASIYTPSQQDERPRH
jgi:hypothetical protein